MSTKEKRYVRSTNGICYVKFSQSLNMKYFMGVEQNVARSCDLFVFLFVVVCFEALWYHPVIRRYVPEQLGNLDRNEGNLARKYSKTKALFKEKLNLCRSFKLKNVLCNSSLRCRWAKRA